MALGKCLLCHIPQSDETLEGMIRFVKYPPSHTTDAGFQVLCANTIAPVVISANNMTDYEIINKADLKNNYGTGSEVMDALSRCRSLFSRVGKEWNDSSIQEKEYFLVKEFERHLKMVQDSGICGKDSSIQEKEYFLVKEFERHLKMVQDSGICGKNQDSASTLKRKVRDACELLPKFELNYQPCGKKVKMESDSAGLPNIHSSENDSQTQHHQSTYYTNSSSERLSNQDRWDQHYKALVSYVEKSGHARVPYRFTQNPSLGHWVNGQRMNYKKFLNDSSSSSMTKDQIDLFNEVGFEWDLSPQTWEERYEQLVKFVKENGHAQVPNTFPQNRPLGHWVTKQRTNYKKFQKGIPSIITKDHIDLLNKVGFEWASCAEKYWEKTYNELVQFVKVNEHARVPNKFAENPSLGRWVMDQRKSYKKSLHNKSSSSMTGDRIELLNKVGFEWDLSPQTWKERYEQLLSFIKENGHAQVPHTFPQNISLGHWVANQRINFKKFQKNMPSSITQDQIDLLNTVGFEWVVRKENYWEKSYDELVEFVREKGHARVPRNFPQNIRLGNWVQKQRLNYKKLQKGESFSLTKNRVELLEKVGFEWVCSPLPWESFYEQLASFLKENGHTRVPEKYSQNRRLGKFVIHQRQNYKKFQSGDISAMTENQILLLNKINFEWDCSAPPWGKRYEELVAFVKDFGHARVPKAFLAQPSLGKWVSTQRTNYKKLHNGEASSMTKDRIELLEKVGFEWSGQAPTRSNIKLWDDWYKELVIFFKENGHANVPNMHKVPLGKWVCDQRKDYKKIHEGDSSSLTENQILLLNKVDFDWRYTVIPWEKRYEELVNFVERNGHAQVPTSFPHFSLGKWVSTQRNNYEKLQNGESSVMTKDQIELLEKVSFEWDGLVKLCPVKLWDERYIELVSFFEENGHAKVPLRFPKNPSLGKWVYAQRQNYKKIQNGDSSSSLTENKILLLNKVDFDWGYEKIPWEKMYEDLLNFVKENGHVRVPRSYPKNLSLGKWVSYQRTSYRRFQIGEVSSMTDDRMKLLKKAGIEWNSLHNTWDDQARVW
eukprot:CAMPEP_0194397160 /NCGR_PEP_ID=MMETSP0174-20130528/125392_1 /TAXON_ID=216777 /ORGANISM="Proboscia alata, Strain PI-D3" /LENGTH=1054 /DNA_ID=CAMNT_0039193311 /DNA_START=335 /DNA_END=3496 /DNA_ORIENTATION=-